MTQACIRPLTFGPAAFFIVATLLSLGGCTQSGWSPPEISRSTNSPRDAGEAGAQRYLCGEGVRFTAWVNDESALLDGDWGKATLLRDAGGQGLATVYSNRTLRAEFGLGSNGRNAQLHELTGLDSSRLPMRLSCQRE